MEKTFSPLVVKIDRDNCIATANCIKVAPEVFELDEERICTFKEDLKEIEAERLVEACAVCPVDALKASDKDGKQIVP